MNKCKLCGRDTFTARKAGTQDNVTMDLELPVVRIFGRFEDPKNIYFEHVGGHYAEHKDICKATNGGRKPK